MIRDKVSGILYEEVYLAPKKAEHRGISANMAVNAVAVVTGKSWSDVVRSLIDQARFRCNMPIYKTCITDMLRANGFKPVPCIKSLSEAVRTCNNSFSLERQYILKLGTTVYFALVPDKAQRRYVLKGTIPYTPDLKNKNVNEIWLYVPGTDNRTWIIGRVKSSEKSSESTNYIVKNMNPDGRRIGDCAVRALSAAYGCTWHEALDHLAATSGYNEVMINDNHNIRATLKRLGFVEYYGLRWEGEYLSGKRFCSELDHILHNGERIFAYLGNRHVAAVITVEENGERHYRVQDIWDSTSKYVEEFWVYRDKNQTATEDSIQWFESGDIVVHPIYGKGTVKKIVGDGKGKIYLINFDTCGEKIIHQSRLKIWL